MDKFSIPKHFLLPVALRKSENQPKSNRGNSTEAPGLIFTVFGTIKSTTSHSGEWTPHHEATSGGHTALTTHKKKSRSFQILHACFHPNDFQINTQSCNVLFPDLFPDRGHHRAPCPLSQLNNMLLIFTRAFSFTAASTPVLVHHFMPRSPHNHNSICLSKADGRLNYIVNQ